jgi:uroporphyrinogen decarboxylase
MILVDYLATREITNKMLQFYSVKSELDLLDVIGSNFYYLSCRDISQNESSAPCYNGPELWVSETERKCPLGIHWKRSAFDDKFAVDEAIKGPFELELFDENVIINHAFPKPDWFDFSNLANECDMIQDKTIIGGLWSAIHGDSYRMMGYENFLLNVAMNRDLVKTLVTRLTDCYIDLNRKYFDCVSGKMNIFFMGNDFGTQNGLLISVEDWHEIYYENYQRLIDLAHQYNLKVMVHSCGAIEELIPYFIELGVDIIDPVQTSARGMDPERLIQEYKGTIGFHGAIDTQRIMPFGSPNEVKEHVIKLVGTLNKYGKYIAAPSNNFLPGTPPENIAMVYKVLHKLNTHGSID